MNTMETVITDLQKKIKSQNFSLEMFGKHSTEFEVDRIIINTTLDTLRRTNYITGYEFSMFDDKIKELELVFGTHKAFITDTDYEIY